MALTVLMQVEKGQAVQSALDAVLAQARRSVCAHADAEEGGCDTHFSRESGLCTELVYGVLRAQIRLSHILHRFLKKPASVPILMRFCLEMSVYSLLFLQKIPPHAAVHWAVDFVRTRFGARMAAVANAVLRNVQREGDAPLHREYYSNALGMQFFAPACACPEVAAAAAFAPEFVAQLAAFYSMPPWIVARWLVAYGAAATEALLARSFAPPYVCVRLRKEHTSFDMLLREFGAAGGRLVTADMSEPAPPDASLVAGSTHAGSAHAAQFCAKGQERAGLSCAAGRGGGVPVAGARDFIAYAFASGTLPHALCGQSVQALHDAGAFSWQAGGSVTALASLAPWSYPVWDACAGQGGKTFALLDAGLPRGLSSDLHVGRLRQFVRTAKRLGYADVSCVRASLVQPPLRSFAGDILVDAPCSGLGTLARRPDIRLHRNASQMEGLLSSQRAMLDAAWRVLKPGHSLVYMTCTLLPEENERQVEEFLARTSNAVVSAQWQTPHEHPWLEGMFAARIRKT